MAMDYRDKVFIAVAEQLSFSKAAKDLFISQPAVTKHIRELENKLSIALFERKGNRVYLTKAGKLAYQHLKKIEQAYREMEFQLGSLNDAHKGELRIGASSTISQYLVPKVMAAFHRRYPKIELFLYNGNSFEMEKLLLESKLDMALVENGSSQSDLRYDNFLEDELVVVTGANSLYAKQKELLLSDLKNLPLVLREKGSGTLEVIQQQMRKQGVVDAELNTLLHLGSTEAIKNFLVEFDGIGIVSEKSIEKELQLQQIVQIPVKGLRIQRHFRTAMRQGFESTVASLFVNFLHSYNF